MRSNHLIFRVGFPDGGYSDMRVNLPQDMNSDDAEGIALGVCYHEAKRLFPDSTPTMRPLKDEEASVDPAVIRNLFVARRKGIPLGMNIEVEQTDPYAPASYFVGQPILSTPAPGFPRLWELFPIILPRSVRERIYEPYLEELKEDYLRERARWTGWYSRKWVTFAFTARTAGAFTNSAWAAIGGIGRRIAVGLVALLLGRSAVETIRELWFSWTGKLP